MNRHLTRWLNLSFSLSFILLAACQPIGPQSEIDAAKTSAAEITETATITPSNAITDSIAITDTSTLTTTDSVSGTTSTPSTPSSGATTTAITTPGESCPAIDPTSDSEPLDISVLANWEEGDQRTYLITQSRLDSENGVEAVTLASTTLVTVTVISADDDGYVLEWHYGQSQLGETDVEVPDPIAALFQTPLQVYFEYSTDNDGAYIELLNIEELQAQLRPMFDQLFDLLAESDEEVSEEALDAARQMVDRLVDDPDNFAALFTRDVQLFHTLHGFYFDSLEPLILPDSRPNILGGAPISSELSIAPTHYDADLNCLHVTFENIADPVAARESIMQTLQQQAQQMGVPGPTDADLPKEIDIIDNIRFEMDVASGWPTAIYTERAINIATLTRVETIDLVLVEPEVE